MTTSPFAFQRATHQLLGRPTAQIVALIAALGLATVVTVTNTWSPGSVVVVGAVIGAALVTIDHEPLLATLLVALSYLSRSRWTAVAYEHKGSEPSIELRGCRTIRWARAQHVGRLDLADREDSAWRHVEEWLTRLAQRGEGTRVSLVELPGVATPDVLLGSEAPLSWPAHWHEVPTPRELAVEGPWWRESWSFLQGRSEYVCVLRLVALPGEANHLFDLLRAPSSEWFVILHAEVQPRSLALRQTRRATHAVRSDSHFAHAWGFLAGASEQREAQNVARREMNVAHGDALLKLSALVVVRAATIAQLDENVEALRSRASDVGCTLQRGWGQQVLWFATAFGGGPSW